MILYIRYGCPFCQKVLNYAEANDIEFELKDIADDEIANELIEKGGKRQVPYLLDGVTGMYESDDIIAYLNGNSEMVKNADECELCKE